MATDKSFNEHYEEAMNGHWAYTKLHPPTSFSDALHAFKFADHDESKPLKTGLDSEAGE